MRVEASQSPQDRAGLVTHLHSYLDQLLVETVQVWELLALAPLPHNLPDSEVLMARLHSSPDWAGLTAYLHSSPDWAGSTAYQHSSQMELGPHPEHSAAVVP